MKMDEGPRSAESCGIGGDAARHQNKVTETL